MRQGPPNPVEFELCTANDPRRFSLEDTPAMSALMRDINPAVSATIRALAPFIS